MAPPPAYGTPQGSSYAPPQGPPPQQYQSQPQYPQGTPSALPGGVSGYPPTSGAPPALSAGAEYQQRLFAMCAAGQHDIETKYGVFGIIMAVVCFPCGLICLFTDTEKRCVRCGARVG
ncbi:hypothetical protein BV20DRAFT_940485 [Pilatotrama ljubarskyi]|nr:hypothetical protein BV20DRAFT_940485 [Pilatotrama ljubarskyi]